MKLGFILNLYIIGLFTPSRFCVFSEFGNYIWSYRLDKVVDTESN